MPSRERAAAALVRASGSLGTAATRRMDDEFGWFRDLSAEARSWVGQIVQSGIRGFVEWYAGDEERPATDHHVAASVFGVAPRDLTGTISLQQTVDLVRLSIEVVERSIEEVVDPDDVADARAAVLRYAREVAFATAEVYARAAEARGAWDARLEALVVDAVVRGEADETVLSRASAVGWSDRGDVAVVLGRAPRRSEADVFDDVRRRARLASMDALCAAQGDRLVVLLGGVNDPVVAARVIVEVFGDGPVVVGPAAPDLAAANVSARAAAAGLRAAPGRLDAPRPVSSLDLLPERVLAGDGHARRYLIDEVHGPLVAARGQLEESLVAYFAHGGSIEATARALFVHANTVRYRLRQIAEVTGYTPTDPRDRFILQLALTLARLNRS